MCCYEGGDSARVLLRGGRGECTFFSAAVEVRIKAAVALSHNLYDFIVNIW